MAGSDQVLGTTCLAPVEAHPPLQKHRTGVRVRYRIWLSTTGHGLVWVSLRAVAEKKKLL